MTATTATGLRWFARGRVLCRTETGDTLLASGALPGESLRLRLHQNGRRREHRVARVLAPSPHRRDSPCSVSDACGGCQLLHVDHRGEVAYCRLTVAEVLSRYTGASVSADDVEYVGNAADFGSRHRMTVHVASQGAAHRLIAASPSIGLRTRLGEILDVDACPAVTPSIRDALAWLRAAPVPSLEVDGLLEITEGVRGDGTVSIALAASKALPVPWLRECVRGGPFDAVAVLDGHRRELLEGRWPRQAPVAGLPLSSALGAWTQPNPRAAERLYRWVLSTAQVEGKDVLDATCGTGGLLLRLAQFAHSVFGIDANWEALKSAQRSAELIGADNVTLRGGKFETVASKLDRSGVSFDVSIVNPMRRSLGPGAMAAVGSMTRSQILYLAPAPRAGAADIEELRQRGWRVTSVAAVNLHPAAASPMAAVAMRRS